MEDNIAYVERTTDLHDGAKDLVRRCIEMAELILGKKLSEEK
ncbi:hypothetical protein [Nitrososphaera viennensis]|uniref:Uncharacterized protein n=2 Tax=Nitrososphaera viennensis TaxID=1034015 RepID=A0A060HKP4_9ARCH|nr:hypothetical protein [Nitrososphaera viennensis]AIC17089.1 hypothetical protein NVIE_028150 [Nitrososphaera viennensis EN76]UVS68982.1 hypothetical protein NWT39_13885 [Nitrososphaera viennensis]